MVAYLQCLPRTFCNLIDHSRFFDSQSLWLWVFTGHLINRYSFAHFFNRCEGTNAWDKIVATSKVSTEGPIGIC